MCWWLSPAAATAARWRTGSACSWSRRMSPASTFACCLRLTRPASSAKCGSTMSRCRDRPSSGNCTKVVQRSPPPLARVIDRAGVALSAEMCGAAQRVLDMTVEYAKLRVAFGKPIGTYQGVKHKCADMLVEIENAKSLTYYAAWAVDEGDAEAALAVSMAKAAASDADRKGCAARIQLHGGIGMTREHDQ